jgi:hypothetical protein
MAKDVAVFLSWAAEPEHDDRKKAGSHGRLDERIGAIRPARGRRGDGRLRRVRVPL